MRFLIPWSLVLSVGFLFPFAAQAQAKDERELIVLLLIDAVRADAVGCYGYSKPTTPVIDELCKKGTRFTRMYSNAPWTRPSTASFLTGLNASRHQTQSYKTKMSKSVKTVAGQLKKQGFKTYGFSANGNGGSLANLHFGFDVFRDVSNTYTKKKRGKTYNRLPTGEFMVARVLEHLAQTKAKKEFLFLFLVDPHDPYGAPAHLEKQFLGADFKGKIRRNALWERNNNYPPDERHSMRAIYDAGIRYSDIAVEQLIEGLKKQGRWDNTTLFVTADHGEGFGEHNFYLHAHHFWNEVIHVPLIAYGGPFNTGRTDERVTQAIDVSATILDLAGADPDAVDGYSLLKPPRDNPHVISEYNEFGIRRQAIVGPRYKVIWQRAAIRDEYMKEARDPKFFPSVIFEGERVRVFDLVKDPGEKKDLSASMPAEAKSLLAQLRAFVAESDRTSAPR
ncbi:MAG: sulfatase [Myxococcota bacterium]